MCEILIYIMKKVIHYNLKLKKLASKLRKNGTLSEVLLWQELKGKKIYGYRFHRQKPIGNYIVDFFCHDLMLAIEIDGVSHDYDEEKFQKDRDRQKKLESLGIRFLRFSEGEVRNNMFGVMNSIRMWIEEHTPSSPAASPPLSRGDWHTPSASRSTPLKRGFHTETRNENDLTYGK